MYILISLLLSSALAHAITQEKYRVLCENYDDLGASKQAICDKMLYSISSTPSYTAPKFGTKDTRGAEPPTIKTQESYSTPSERNPPKTVLSTPQKNPQNFFSKPNQKSSYERLGFKPYTPGAYKQKPKGAAKPNEKK